MKLHAFGAVALVAMSLSACGGDGTGTNNTTTGDGGTTPPTGLSTVTGRWSAVMTGTSVDLYGIYGSAANSLVAVGPQTIRRFNGTAWSAGPDTEYTLKGVGGAGASTFIVGITVPKAGSADTGMGVILRLMGTTLMGMRHPTPMAQYAMVWARAENDAWAVGQDIVVHWDGTNWVNTSMMGIMQGPMSNPASDLYAVWASGPNDVRAVGKKVYRWDGATWTNEPQPGNDYYYGIWGTGPRDVWMVGSGVGRHYNGTEWSDVRVGTQSTLRAIWGAAANDIWAGGDGGVMVHWDGARWTAFPSGTTQTIRAIVGFGAGDIWAVGQGGACVHYTR